MFTGTKMVARIRRLLHSISVFIQPYRYDERNPYRRWHRKTGQPENWFTYVPTGHGRWEPVTGPLKPDKFEE